MPLVIRDHLHDEIIDSARTSQFGPFYVIDDHTLGIRLEDGARIRLDVHEVGRESPKEHIPYTETHIVVLHSLPAETITAIEAIVEDALVACFQPSITTRLTRLTSCQCERSPAVVI